MRTNSTPPRPVGNSPEAFFHQRVWDNVFGAESQFIDSDTVTVEKSTRGITMRAQAPRPGEAIAISRYRLKTVQGNYLVCRTWNGTDEGETDTYIAKVFKLRINILTETIDGIVFNYSNQSGNVSRIARSADNSIVETQVIVPRFLVDDEIWAIDADTGLQTVPGVGQEAEDIVLMDMNFDARVWTRAV